MGEIAKARQLHQQLGQMAQPTNVIKAQDQTGTNASLFPVQLGSADPMDEAMNIREQTINGSGVVPGMGMAVADQSVFDYIQRKKENMYEVQYQMWLANQADLSKPESQQWWFERFPWMRDRRLAEIDRDAELQKGLAKINVTGPQNDDDFKLLFAIQQGLVQIPEQPIHKLNQEKWVRADFKSGIFSPLSIKPQTGVQGSQGMPKSTVQIPKWSDPLNSTAYANGTFPGIPSRYVTNNTGANQGLGLFPAGVPAP